MLPDDANMHDDANADASANPNAHANANANANVTANTNTVCISVLFLCHAKKAACLRTCVFLRVSSTLT